MKTLRRWYWSGTHKKKGGMHNPHKPGKEHVWQSWKQRMYYRKNAEGQQQTEKDGRRWWRTYIHSRNKKDSVRQVQKYFSNLASLSYWSYDKPLALELASFEVWKGSQADFPLSTNHDWLVLAWLNKLPCVQYVSLTPNKFKNRNVGWHF